MRSPGDCNAPGLIYLLLGPSPPLRPHPRPAQPQAKHPASYNFTTATHPGELVLTQTVNRMQILLFLWKGGLKVFEIIPQDRKVNIQQNNTRYIADILFIVMLILILSMFCCHVSMCRCVMLPAMSTLG